MTSRVDLRHIFNQNRHYNINVRNIISASNEVRQVVYW